MVLDRIQAHLEAIYGLKCELRASDYLVDEEMAMRLGATGRTREELLVCESPEGLELQLFVAPEVIDRLEPLAPAAAVIDELAGFCEAAEGVSHFMYLQRAAGLDRTVSFLELEAQGEVDKFAACCLSTWALGSGLARELLRRLFQAVQFNQLMSTAEQWRYREANHLAKAYCLRLLKLVEARQLEPLLAELRHMYRMGAEAKLAYLKGR